MSERFEAVVDGVVSPKHNEMSGLKKDELYVVRRVASDGDFAISHIGTSDVINKWWSPDAGDFRVVKTVNGTEDPNGNSYYDVTVTSRKALDLEMVRAELDWDRPLAIVTELPEGEKARLIPVIGECVFKKAELCKMESVVKALRSFDCQPTTAQTVRKSHSM
jgi:hypothetical protein